MELEVEGVAAAVELEVEGVELPLELGVGGAKEVEEVCPVLTWQTSMHWPNRLLHKDVMAVGIIPYTIPINGMVGAQPSHLVSRRKKQKRKRKRKRKRKWKKKKKKKRRQDKQERKKSRRREGGGVFIFYIYKLPIDRPRGKMLILGVIIYEKNNEYGYY